MHKIILATAIAALLSACGENNSTQQAEISAAQSETVTVDKQAAVAEAKQITQDFVSSLKGELQAAMKSGGPSKAIEVCNQRAMEITREVAEKHNAQLSRVSLKNRNPQNVPNDWQKKVLEDFDKRAAAGEDVQKMAAAVITEVDGKKQLRFMKAMPTGEVCLACHGKKIEPGVKTILQQLYPEDKATGYEKGQVRGAVVVVKDL